MINTAGRFAGTEFCLLMLHIASFGRRKETHEKYLTCKRQHSGSLGWNCRHLRRPTTRSASKRLVA